MKRNRFEAYELHPRILARLPEIGFSHPTKVQEKVIPRFFQKKNMIVEAPTGTGKTAAYGLPLISRLDLLKNRTQALILVPSRELALQVKNALLDYFKGPQLKVEAIYGGVSMSTSQASIKSRAHIVVAVPGRLKDVMSHTQYDFFWKDIRHMIIDEGDKLMEQGFQKDFESIRFHIRKNVHICFFSATIAEEIENLILASIPYVEVIRLHPQEMLRNIGFSFIRIHKGRREAYLLGLFEAKEIHQALIFCRRREDVHGLTSFLRNCGLKAEGYYGSQEQRERTNILQRFREGHIEYLIASDLAARGLDIKDLPVVINISMPKAFDYYLHRVGRTGRAGRTGDVYNLIVTDKEFNQLKDYHKQIKIPCKPLLIAPVKSSTYLAAMESRWMKYALSRGKKDKMRKGDIVGFLIQMGQLKMDEVGTITIYDTYTTVDLPTKGYDNLINCPFPLKIKGKSVKIRKFTQDEQIKRARAIKNLKKDRKKVDKG